VRARVEAESAAERRMEQQAKMYQAHIDQMTQLLNAARKSGNLTEISKAQQEVNVAVLDGVKKAVADAKVEIEAAKKTQTVIKVCVCGRVNSGKSTSINAMFNPNPPAVTSAAENTRGFAMMTGTSIDGDSNLEVYDVQGVSDELFAQHLDKIVKLATFDCIIFVYTDSIKNVQFLLQTCVATKAPVVCLRNKSDKDDEIEIATATADDKSALQLWFPNDGRPIMHAVSARTKMGFPETAAEIKKIALANLAKFK